MKRLIAITLFSCAVFFCGSLSAQTQKIGFVDLVTVFDSIPQSDTVEMKIQEMTQAYSEQLKEVERRAEQARTLYMEESSKPAPNNRLIELYSSNYQKAEQDYQTLTQQANQDISEERNSLQLPVIAYIKKVTAEIAKEKGFTQILNAGEGALFFNSQPSSDITKMVIDKIIATSKAAKPAQPAPQPAPNSTIPR